MNDTITLITALVTPFIAAAVAPYIYNKAGRRVGLLVSLTGAFVPFLLLIRLASHVSQSAKPLLVEWAWVPSIQLSLSFLLDGFGLLFALLVSGMGVLIVLYAHFYMAHEDHQGRFFSYLLFFLGSMLGVCIGHHLFTFFFFWELTSLSSFLLIGFWDQKEKSRAGALKALVITTGGALFMMAGFASLGAQSGMWTWTSLASISPSFLNETWATWALILILIGAFTKSAQTPFHIWLPDAMEAPTPVSAFLHSATMVKAGIILIYRLYPIFSDHFLWFPLLSIVGMTTVVVGAILALKHTDLKAILAYSTISQLGLFVVMQGYAAWDDILRAGLMFHIFVHAFYKGGLFMITGIIDHAAHTREITKLGNLWRYMARTGVFLFLAAASLAGLPPFLGFISKEAVLEASLHMAHLKHGWTYLLPMAMTVAATLTVAVAFKISMGIFFHSPKDPSALLHEKPHELGWGILIPPALIASAGLIFGLMPGLLEHTLYPLALVGESLPAPHFKLWHGLTPALALSGTAVLGGALVYRFRNPVQQFQEKLKLSWNLNTVYNRSWDGILKLAEKFTNRYQSGSLSQYVITTVGFFAALLGWTAWTKPDWSIFKWTMPNIISGESVTALGVVVFAMLVVILKERIARLVSLGGVGIMIVVYFVFRGAPDLALTGFLIEIAMFVLILLVFNQIKDEPEFPSEPHRIYPMVISIAAGSMLALLTYVAVTVPHPDAIYPYFVENSQRLAGGLNIVNVIVVDFRGFDTMGEISVLVLAAMGVYSLRQVWAGKKERAQPPSELFMRSLPRSPILEIVSLWAFPLILVFAFYIVFRGHNAPGGGFIGGLITAAALVLECIAVGRNRFMRKVPFSPSMLYAVGLILAFGTGLVPLFFGYPFLTSYVFETFHFSTASIFDLGVYCVVVGVTLDIMLAMEQSERKPT